MNEVRDVILDAVREHLDLDREGFEILKAKGRLDELTAVDSLLMVELVLTLEERFNIRFKAEDIDAELINELDRLAAFVAEALTREEAG